METNTPKASRGEIKQPLWYTIVFYTCFFLGLIAMVAGAFTANARFSTLANGSFLIGMIITIVVWRQIQAQ
jgi:hypothetical protein